MWTLTRGWMFSVSPEPGRLLLLASATSILFRTVPSQAVFCGEQHCRLGSRGMTILFGLPGRTGILSAPRESLGVNLTKGILHLERLKNIFPFREATFSDESTSYKDVSTNDAHDSSANCGILHHSMFKSKWATPLILKVGLMRKTSHNLQQKE